MTTSTGDSDTSVPPPQGMRRAARPRLPRAARIALLLAPALIVVAVFFVGGVSQTIAQSFGYQPYLPGDRLSFDAYIALWSDPAVRASLPLTARVAGVSTLLATVLGVAVALTIRGLGRSRTTVTAVVGSTLAVPHLVGAVCMLLLLSQSGLLARFGYALGLTSGRADFPALTNDGVGFAIIAEYVWKEAPFIAVIALAALGRGIDELEGAATSLGADRRQRLVHVTLPMLAPPVAGAAVLVIAYAAGSYEVPYLLGSPYPTTLPVVAFQSYSATDLTTRPTAMAIAVMITVTSSVVVLVYLAAVGRLARRAP